MDDAEGEGVQQSLTLFRVGGGGRADVAGFAAVLCRPAARGGGEGLPFGDRLGGGGVAHQFRADLHDRTLQAVRAWWLGAAERGAQVQVGGIRRVVSLNLQLITSRATSALA